MKWSVGKKIGMSSVLALVIIGIIGVSSYLGLNRLLEANRWQIHTYQVQTALEDVLSLLKDAETGQRGYIITNASNYLEPYNTATGKLQTSIAELKKLTADNSAQQERIVKLQTKVAEKASDMAETIALRKEKGFEPALQIIMTGKGKRIMDEIRALTSEMSSEEDRLMKERSRKADDATRSTKAVIVVGILSGITLMVLIGLLLGRDIAKPLTVISAAADQAAAGDLSVNIPFDKRSDEIGVLVGAFRQMTNNLRSSVTEISQGVAVLGSSASEILAATTQVATGSAENATAISETTTTVEEVRQAAQLSSDKAKNVAENAKQVAQISQSGRKAVEETVAGMSHVRAQMEAIAQTIVRLSEQSQSIDGIITSVTDLADQSNLLAVNAAIEAARAGEQGKGFAVVAQEIKSLAEQSKQATAQVRTILSDVQKATNAAVMATEQGNKAVEAGMKQSAQAGEAIRALTEQTGAAAQAAVQIVTSSQQQVVGMNQIGAAMENINQAGTQTAASMKQAEVAAQNLYELGQKLKDLVGKFKT